MDSYRRSKAQSILEKHIDELRSIYEKKEAEQKILNQKIKILKKSLNIKISKNLKKSQKISKYAQNM